jgi:O-glycosyl hydrolase
MILFGPAAEAAGSSGRLGFRGQRAISDADADLFFDQNLSIGLSILRVGTTPTGGNHADWSNITKAAARGAIVWATPFSPPANCKSNNSLTDGGHLNPSCAEQNGSVTKRLYTMGNYSKFVRPGYERVGVSGSVPSGVQVSAYRNPADDTVVIVAINSNTSPTAVSVFVSNGASCEVPPWVTSASDDLVAQSPVSISAARFTTTLAGPSVTTFVGTP